MTLALIIASLERTRIGKATAFIVCGFICLTAGATPGLLRRALAERRAGGLDPGLRLGARRLDRARRVEAETPPLRRDRGGAMSDAHPPPALLRPPEDPHHQAAAGGADGDPAAGPARRRPAPFDPRALMPGAAEVWLEIGFGGGEHMAAQAARRPDVLIIGAEPFQNGVASALRHIDEAQLTNVRVLDGDARELMADLPDASLDRVFVLFPDPWPKTRHHKRRVVQADTRGRARAPAEARRAPALRQRLWPTMWTGPGAVPGQPGLPLDRRAGRRLARRRPPTTSPPATRKSASATAPRCSWISCRQPSRRPCSAGSRRGSGRRSAPARPSR